MPRTNAIALLILFTGSVLAGCHSDCNGALSRAVTAGSIALMTKNHVTGVEASESVLFPWDSVTVVMGGRSYDIVPGSGAAGAVHFRARVVQSPGGPEVVVSLEDHVDRTSVSAQQVADRINRSVTQAIAAAKVAAKNEETWTN